MPVYMEKSVWETSTFETSTISTASNRQWPMTPRTAFLITFFPVMIRLIHMRRKLIFAMASEIIEGRILNGPEGIADRD